MPRHVQNGSTILVVEDHDDTLSAMKRLLAANGYVVLTARTAEEALQMVQKQRCDLLLSDIMLPKLSGIDLMRQLKDQFAIPGVALSGCTMCDEISAAMAAGFVKYLKKPVVFTSLMQAIEEALAQSTPAGVATPRAKPLATPSHL